MGNFMSYYHTSEDSPFNQPVAPPDPCESPPMPTCDEVPDEIKEWTGHEEEDRSDQMPTWRSVFTRHQWKKHVEELHRRCRAGSLGAYGMTQKEQIAVNEFHNNQ